MLKRKTWGYAPDNYSAKEAKAWAAGWNHAVDASSVELNPAPVIKLAAARLSYLSLQPPPRKAELGDVGFTNSDDSPFPYVRHDWWVSSPLSPRFRPYAAQTERVIGMHPALGMGYGPRSVSERIRDYLVLGGLFNPELANHQAVRDLLIDACDTIEALKAIVNR